MFVFFFISVDNNDSNESGRKTKSKEAARMRRNKENDEFKILASLLPLQVETTQTLDKAAIIRLAINFIKIRKFFDDFKIPMNNTSNLYFNFYLYF